MQRPKPLHPLHLITIFRVPAQLLWVGLKINDLMPPQTARFYTRFHFAHGLAPSDSHPR
ncbi:unnamed protein product [Chondrus crispus]|uniref:Uncharacterized protein n=1 Tax=Chondrus crispus TaxID=2769 RepID=R7Q7H0_CHOCR|nr:unnamed protein product [Chondrus crispus]CDF33964.1 unnamed protein product [Chondrus crispus]|eukprot:XP_005713783.1 unnamed protein product [Chondrus crispus]